MQLTQLRQLRRAAVAAVVVGVIVFLLGWYAGAHDESESDERFESCRFDGEVLRLSWSYGAGDTVSPEVQQHSGEVVVSLEIDHADNLPDVGLIGRARFAIHGGQETVRYPDGDELDCQRREGPGH